MCDPAHPRQRESCCATRGLVRLAQSRERLVNAHGAKASVLSTGRVTRERSPGLFSLLDRSFNLTSGFP